MIFTFHTGSITELKVNQTVIPSPITVEKLLFLVSEPKHGTDSFSRGEWDQTYFLLDLPLPVGTMEYKDRHSFVII